MKKIFREIALLLVLVLISLNTGCANKKDYALVVGCEQFSGVFSPFFAVTDYDADVANMTGITLLKTDPTGALTSFASEYIPPQEIKNSNGDTEKTIYTFKLVKNIKFSDGTYMTADDVMFSFKVLCDPSYDGISNISTLPIIGINEYKYDDLNYQTIIDDLSKKSKNINQDELYAFITKSAAKDYEEMGEEAVVQYIGFENTENLQDKQKTDAIIKAYADYEFKNSADYYFPLAEEDKFKALNQEYFANNSKNSKPKVTEISGIKKVDDLTVTVEIAGVSPVALWDLGSVNIAPLNYYGKGNNNSVYEKGNLAIVKEKNSLPKGAGPYVFQKYENNVVTFNANPHYFKGKPKIASIKFQVVNSANRIESIAKGELDIADVMATKEALQAVKEKNLHYSLVGNLGYGYIGINSKRISDINVRKGLMHLMNRAPAVDSYYGELATVIERPLSKTSWAYPNGAMEVYPFNPQAALEYFEKAGYVQATVSNKTVLKKGNNQLKIQVGIGGEGIMDHPSAPILTQMKLELEKMGGILDIVDCDMSLLVENLDGGKWDMWAASWELTIDPDVYQKYYSGAPSNYYGLENKELDDLLVKARSINNIEQRKVYYEKCFDIVMNEAVEMPVYQRMNMYVYNKKTLDINSLPKNITTFYDYFAEIENLKLLSR